MANTPSLNAGMLTSPITDPRTGEITLEWRAWLQNLWQRTGGAIGQDSTNPQLQAALAAEVTAREVADAGLTSDIAAEAAARIAADAFERSSRIAGDQFLQMELDAETAARKLIVVVLPLATGDLPGPVLIADAVGQCVGAPLS